MRVPHSQRYTALPLYELQWLREHLGGLPQDAQGRLIQQDSEATGRPFDYPLMAKNLLALSEELLLAYEAIAGVPYRQGDFEGHVHPEPTPRHRADIQEHLAAQAQRWRSRCLAGA